VATGTFAAGGVTATLVVVPADRATGDVCLVSSAAAHLVLDVVGWIGTDRSYTSAAVRLVDTRPGAPARSNVRGPVTPTRPLTVPLTGLLPQGSTAAVVTVIVTSATGTGSVTIRSCSAATPVASVPATLTATAQSSATVLIAVGDRSPRWCLTTTARTVHVVVELVGAATTPPR
jgi:hypothetical protein